MQGTTEILDTVDRASLTARFTCLPDNLMSLAFGVGARPTPQRLALKEPVEVQGEEVEGWNIYPTTFAEQMDSLSICEDTKKWSLQRAAEQATGALANGSELVLTQEGIRGMDVSPAKALLRYVQLLGSAPSAGAALVTKDGDGISTPLVMQLGQPVEGVTHLTFQAQTMAELEQAATMAGSMRQRLADLLYCTGEEWILEHLTPSDGWFIVNKALTQVNKAADKSLKSIRSYEYMMKMAFAPETHLRVIARRQHDYANLHTNKIKAQKAASRGRR